MKYFNTQLEFSGTTLLSADEAKSLLTEQERKYKYHWWLRSPGYYSYYAVGINYYGDVIRTGYHVNYGYCIRPALQIANLGDFKVGDVFSIGEYYFKIISPELAWLYKQDIGTDYFDEKSNNYVASHIKAVIDSWFEKLKEEMI